jgi:hypothetical protein
MGGVGGRQRFNTVAKLVSYDGAAYYRYDYRSNGGRTWVVSDGSNMRNVDAWNFQHSTHPFLQASYQKGYLGPRGP